MSFEEWNNGEYIRTDHYEKSAHRSGCRDSMGYWYSNIRVNGGRSGCLYSGSPNSEGAYEYSFVFTVPYTDGMLRSSSDIGAFYAHEVNNVVIENVEGHRSICDQNDREYAYIDPDGSIYSLCYDGSVPVYTLQVGKLDRKSNTLYGVTDNYAEENLGQALCDDAALGMMVLADRYDFNRLPPSIRLLPHETHAGIHVDHSYDSGAKQMVGKCSISGKALGTVYGDAFYRDGYSYRYDPCCAVLDEETDYYWIYCCNDRYEYRTETVPVKKLFRTKYEQVQRKIKPAYIDAPAACIRKSDHAIFSFIGAPSYHGARFIGYADPDRIYMVMPLLFSKGLLDYNAGEWFCKHIFDRFDDAAWKKYNNSIECYIRCHNGSL